MEQTIIDKIKSGIETALDIKELGQIVSKFWNNKEKQEYFIKAYKEVMILYKSKYGIDLIYFTNAPKEDKGDEDWNPYIERMKKKLEENKNPIDLLEKIKECWRVSEKDLDENLEFLTQKFLEKILQYGCMNGEEVIVQIYWEIRKIHCALWSLQKHIDNDERYSPQNNGNNLFEKDNKINEKCHEYAGRYEEELPPMGDDSISVSLKQLYVEPEYSLVYPYESKREGLVFSYLKEFLHSEEKKKKKILFVEGDAGIGKTSLVSKIAYHYEHPNEESELGNDFFVGIRVICIRLRDMLEKSQTLNIENPWEDIFQYLNIAKENQRNELKRWSVLILDGFDELCMVESIQSEKKLDYFINLSRNLQSGRIYWKVIVTSRPNYIGWENLKKDLKGCMEIIQLQHFSIKKRNEWVEKAKEVELLITEDVKQGIIDSNREELEAIIGVPWTLYLIIRKAIVITANSNLWEIYNSIFKGENVTRSFEEEAHPTRSLQNDLYRITEEIAFWMYQNQCFDISLDTIRSLIDRIYEEADQEEKLRFLIQLKDTYALHTYYRKTDQRGGIAFYHNYIQDFFLSEEVFFELDKVYRELKQLKKWSQKEKCLICCYNRIFLPSILNEKVVQFIRFRIRYEYENNLLSKWVETEKENHIFAQVFENMMIYGFMDLNRKKITQKIKLQAMQTIFCNCWNIYDYVYSLQKKENHIFSDIIERNGNELGDLRKVIVENILKNVNFQKLS